MTPNEITTLIATNLQRELDIPFRLQLMERVKYWRSRLIANSLQKKPAERIFFRQSIYLPMRTAFAADCIAGIGDKQSITTVEVPLLVREVTLFDYIGGIDGKSPFRRAIAGTQNYLDTGKFAGMFPYYEFVNQIVYVGKTGLPKIRIDAIFDDPMAVKLLDCACNHTTDCDTWDMQFPCSGDLMQLIVQSILNVDYNRPSNKPTPEIPV